MNDPSSSWTVSTPLPEGGAHAVDYNAAVQPQPRISRVLNAIDGKHRYAGACPICKDQLICEWEELKTHVQGCHRLRHHPLLMRTCYCPYCVKKFSDHYALSAHIWGIHKVTITKIREEYKGRNMRKEDDKVGVIAAQMREPFPFHCSECKLCWPTAQGIAAHFVKNEMSCGGIVEVKITDFAKRVAKKHDKSITPRYDFARPIVCSFCPEVFTEAYALSHHISTKHKMTVQNLERKLAPSVDKNPKKKLFFEPFMCANCRATFKTMAQWAAHIDSRILGSNQCLGDLKIFKFIKGKGIFRSNVSPIKTNTADDPIEIEDPSPSDQQTRKLTDDGTCSKQNKAACMGMSMEALETDEVQKEIKDEAIDPDELLAAPVDPVIKKEPTEEDDAFERKRALAAAAYTAACGEAVVKEEPLDDEPMDESEPQQLQPPVPYDRVKEEPEEEREVKEEEQEEEDLTCDECRITFTDERTLIDHMKIHGFELSNEDEVRRIEMGEYDEPASKRRRDDDEGNAGTSRSSRPKYPELPGNDLAANFPCQSCDEICLTMTEYIDHLAKFHYNSSPLIQHTCSICKRRKFETVEKLKAHEPECLLIKAMEAREKSFNEYNHCPYCGKRQANAFVLGSHLMSEHGDIIKRLRHHHLMASEFLPFRCTACNVGYEDARQLLDHFRLKEEFGKGCEGKLVVHDYQLSLKAYEKMKQEASPVPVPELPVMDDMDYDIYADIYKNEYIPSDHNPPAPHCSTRYIRRCPACTEVWPIEQMKWHIKMEHPKFYYDNAHFKCKRCKQYSFYCEKHYEVHYEGCKENEMNRSNDKVLACAFQGANPEKPSMHKGINHRHLKPFPENIGNEMRPCRFCKQVFSPEGLLCHQKQDHPLEHFTNAPYLCGKCDEVGFYSHQEFKYHGTRCTGTTPVQLQTNVYAITVKEVEIRTGIKREEVPSYRAIVDADRRKDGTLAAFHRSHTCHLCHHWCSSLQTMDEHIKDVHLPRIGPLTPFLCGGCGIVFTNAADLKKHLKNQEVLGNIQCFDMASTHSSITNSINSMRTQQFIMPMDPTRYVKAPPLVAPRTSEVQRTLGSSPLIANWRAELGLEPNQRTPGLVMSLSRQQASIKRNAPLLPIRPISQLAKSPLSGERQLYMQQQLNASRNRASSYYRQVSVFEKQRSITQVDLSTPLSLPSTSISHRPSFMDNRFDPTEPLRNEPLRLPQRGLSSRPAGATALRPTMMPRLQQQLPRPHQLQQHASFRAGSTSSSPFSAAGPIRFRRVSSTGTTQRVAPPVQRGSAQPKTEPKQEPL